jgi:hypothetical protein
MDLLFVEVVPTDDRIIATAIISPWRGEVRYGGVALGGVDD